MKSSKKKNRADPQRTGTPGRGVRLETNLDRKGTTGLIQKTNGEDRNFGWVALFGTFLCQFGSFGTPKWKNHHFLRFTFKGGEGSHRWKKAGLSSMRCKQRDSRGTHLQITKVALKYIAETGETHFTNWF